MYEAHVKARAVEEMRQQRDQMIAAYYANPTWDEKDNREKRDENIRQLREQFTEAQRFMYAADEQRSDGFEEDPLFAPLARQRRLEAQARPQMPNEGRAYELGIDPALGI